jgi:hypothetical protein
MNDETLELYGGVRICLTEAGDTMLVDDEELYEAEFSPEEWDRLVDHVHNQRCRRMQ